MDQEGPAESPVVWEHGGNVREMCARFELDPADVVDFSANINPLGASENVAALLASPSFPDWLAYPENGASKLPRQPCTRPKARHNPARAGYVGHPPPGSCSGASWGSSPPWAGADNGMNG